MRSYMTGSPVNLPLVSLIFIILCTLNLPAFSESSSFSEVLKKRRQQWNDFVDHTYAFHKHRIEKIDHYTEEELGGYGGLTNDLEFYKAVSYFEKGSNLVLAVIKWETKRPDKLHAIDVYVYDDEGRRLREYSASFLPTHRSAPFDTLITLHSYKDDLHSFREFDASNDHLYEQCQSISNPRQVYFALPYEEIPASYREVEQSKQDRYRECFDDLPRSAEPYTNPLTELQGHSG